MVDPVRQEHQVHLVVPVDHRSSARKSKFHHAIHAHLDRRDHRDLTARQETQADQDRADDRVTMAHRDLQDRTAHQDQVARQATMVHRVKQDDQHKAHQVFPAKLAPQVTLDCRVRPVTTEHPVAMVNQDRPVPMVHPALQDSPVIMASQVHQAMPASQALRANEVFVRNTAHWMVASSSRMVRDVDEAYTNTRNTDHHHHSSTTIHLYYYYLIIRESVVGVCSKYKKEDLQTHTLRRVLYG